LEAGAYRYQRHQPENNLLYRIVERHYPEITASMRGFVCTDSQFLAAFAMSLLFSGCPLNDNACNALGIKTELQTPHTEYLLLGKTKEERLENYRALFKAHVNAELF
jgi:hypothetical protein